jgi:hypothetical protein
VIAVTEDPDTLTGGAPDFTFWDGASDDSLAQALSQPAVHCTEASPGTEASLGIEANLVGLRGRRAA